MEEFIQETLKEWEARAAALPLPLSFSGGFPRI